MYRFYSELTTHFEIGPKISLIRSTTQTLDNQAVETANRYEDTYYSAVVGFGGFLAGSDVMTLKMGLRAEYSLSDLVATEGEQEGYPAFYQDFSDYRQTHPFRAGFYLELTFGVGNNAKRMCGRRMSFGAWRTRSSICTTR